MRDGRLGRISPAWLLVAPAFLSLIGCDQARPKLPEAEIQRIKQTLPGLTEACLAKVRLGGIDAIGPEVDRCFHMTPARLWRGLWRDDFEGSRFCPAPARRCAGDMAGEMIRLSFGDHAGPRTSDLPGRLYRIEFIGRRTRMPFLHSIHAEHEMIADRIVSVRVVEERQ